MALGRGVDANAGHSLLARAAAWRPGSLGMFVGGTALALGHEIFMDMKYL
jgi:hypothetical protein